MHQCKNFILFWNDILHVSDGLSVHHQEFKTVHTATNWFCCLLASKQTAVSVSKCLLVYVQSWTPDDGRKYRPKHVECHSKIKQIWYIGVSSWFYCRNNITMHGPMNVKFNEQYCILTLHKHMFGWICCTFMHLCVLYHPDDVLVVVEACRKNLSVKWLLITKSATCWIRYCVISLLHRTEITLHSGYFLTMLSLSSSWALRDLV